MWRLGRAVACGELWEGTVTPLLSPSGVGAFPVTYDIAVISLAQPIPVTTLAPVRLLMLQQGQAGFPTTGTTITMVGYGAFGTGSNPPHSDWDPTISGTPPPIVIDATNDNRRRVGMSSLASYGPTTGGGSQLFFTSVFRDPSLVPAQPLEAGVAPGDSGGPLFAVIDGQLVQIRSKNRERPLHALLRSPCRKRLPPLINVVAVVATLAAEPSAVSTWYKLALTPIATKHLNNPWYEAQ